MFMTRKRLGRASGRRKKALLNLDWPSGTLRAGLVGARWSLDLGVGIPTLMRTGWTRTYVGVLLKTRDSPRIWFRLGPDWPLSVAGHSTLGRRTHQRSFTAVSSATEHCRARAVGRRLSAEGPFLVEKGRSNSLVN